MPFVRNLHQTSPATQEENEKKHGAFVNFASINLFEPEIIGRSVVNLLKLQNVRRATFLWIFYCQANINKTNSSRLMSKWQ